MVAANQQSAGVAHVHSSDTSMPMNPQSYGYSGPRPTAAASGEINSVRLLNEGAES